MPPNLWHRALQKQHILTHGGGGFVGDLIHVSRKIYAIKGLLISNQDSEFWESLTFIM